jgi:hypothetical protein
MNDTIADFCTSPLSTFMKLAKLAARATPTLTSLYFSKIGSLVKSVCEFRYYFAKFHRVFAHPAHHRSSRSKRVHSGFLY